jgi:hypothetical protein
MLTKHSVELLKLLDTALKTPGVVVKSPRSGREAAEVTVELMARTFATLPPIKIVNAFDKERDLWAAFKAPTVKVIADGIRTLAAVWQGAWEAGGGPALSANKLKLADTGDLIELYEDTGFIESLVLADIGEALGL